jgi:hypothetical protein
MKLKNVLALLLEASQYDIEAEKIISSDIISKLMDDGVSNEEAQERANEESKKIAAQLISKAKEDTYLKQKSNSIVLLALLYTWEDSIQNVVINGSKYIKLLLKNKIGNFEIRKPYKTMAIKKSDGKDLVIDNFIDFHQYVDGLDEDDAPKREVASAGDWVPTTDKPIMSSNGIDVYEGRSVGRCIEYSHYGVTPTSYSFCIGAKGGGNAYSGYRVRHGSTFYFIVDKNRMPVKPDGSLDTSDPLHIIVYDLQKDGTVQLTDSSNRTGHIAEFGTSVEGYQNYLKKMGIDYTKFKNRPMSEEEKWTNEITKNTNPSVDFLIDLIKYGQSREEELEPGDKKVGALRYLSHYIILGNPLSDEQFDWLYTRANK